MKLQPLSLILVALLCGISSLHADTKLTGTPISSYGSFDYNNTGSPSFSVNTAQMAFDGSMDSYFAAWDVSYGWVGLDLGSPHIITIVGWAPRKNSVGPNGVLLGVFEGANRPDFMDAVPLHLIDNESLVGQMNYTTVKCSRGFRYVRYVGPYSMRSGIAELEFYGDKGEGDDSQLCQLTNIPVVTIHTKDNQIPFDKETDIDGYVSIISQDGKHILSDTITIRERGNASRQFPKKPYRIKFEHKQSVLGSPAKAKKWTLINNYGDKTLLRNPLAYEISKRLNMPFTPFCTPVNVLLNGEYKGCYQLSDQIEVDKNRVNIKEMEPTDNSGEALTGGYFIEVDGYADTEISYFYSQRGTPVTIKSPDEEEITPEQKNYIASHFSLMENNPAKYLDYNTFIRHFIVGELSGNTDTYWSTYMYKHRGNDTLFVGPVWDFDIAFDNDYRTYPINNKNDYVYRSGGSVVGYMRTLTDKVINSSQGADQLLITWIQARWTGIDAGSLCAYIDQQAQNLQQSQRLNFLRWPILNSNVHMNPTSRGSYQAEVDYLKKYIENRIVWFDRKLKYVHTEVENIDNTQKPTKYIHNGQLYIQKGEHTYTVMGNKVQ